MKAPCSFKMLGAFSMTQHHVPREVNPYPANVENMVSF